MKQVLILGAGKSSIYIIDRLIEHQAQWNIQVMVADMSIENLEARVGNKSARKILLESGTVEEIETLFIPESIVISMLPPFMHIEMAKLCLKYKCHLITPSYISEAMQALDAEAKQNDLVFLNEMGLDPGIDHMSAKQIIDEWQAKGAVVKGLRSHCGGLVAPSSDTNSWHYKISWNPRNVVLAGAGSDFIKYKSKGESVLLRYEELFAHTSEIRLDATCVFESYPNRDSLKYETAYGLQGIATLYRGTLRVPPFCKGWQKVVALGLTSTEQAFPLLQKSDVQDSEVADMLQELGVFDVPASDKKAADILQQLLEQKWVMEPTDKDRVVMIHEFEMEYQGKEIQIRSSLVLDGDNQLYTAMSKTVGLPIVFATEMLLNGELKSRGILMPLDREIYEPVLQKLETEGICFQEEIARL
jgi:saccharopine dehydrogenase-like NADP-dependent oxidoreductase